MHHDTIIGLNAVLEALNRGDTMEAESTIDMILTRLQREAGENVYIVWTPEDLDNYDLAGMTPNEALDRVRGDLEDCSHGWDIIDSWFNLKSEEDDA